MARQTSQLLDPTPLAAKQARAFVSDACREWGLDDVVDTVELLTSELVTNGILHAHTDLAVNLTLSDGAVVVEVHDHDLRDPISRGHRVDLLADIDALIDRGPLADTDDRHQVMEVGPAGSIGAGRGLLLVESLADEWGVERYADGKGVWFRIGPPT